MKAISKADCGYEIAPEQTRAIGKFYGNHFRGIAWWKAGEGKTRLGLRSWWEIRNEALKLLVITRRKAFEDWRAEALEKMHLKARVVELEKVVATDLSDAIPTIILLSHGSLRKVTECVPPLPLHEMVLIIDEAYLFANVSSQRSVMAQWIQRRVLGVISLSATIMPAQDNLAIYGQACATGLGHVLARNKSHFIEQYQERIAADYIPTGFKMRNKRGSYDKILKKLEPYIDLHYPLTNNRIVKENIIDITPNAIQKRAIDQLKKTYEFRGRKYKNVLEVLHCISGIANGWYDPKDGTVENIPSAKVDKLQAIVEEYLAAGERLIIWCAYRNDVKRVMDALPCPSIPFLSGVPFDSHAWKSGKANVVVATEGSGASVNHFEQVSTAIYFSTNYRWVDLQQSMARTDRRSSAHLTCYYIHLHLRGSFDKDILNTVRTSKSDEESVIYKLGKLLNAKSNPDSIGSHKQIATYVTA